jgi:hypothetical protein
MNKQEIEWRFLNKKSQNKFENNLFFQTILHES